MSVTFKVATKPAFVKMGLFGGTGTGKTYTAGKVLSQFIAEFVKGGQLAMFDTEPAAGYIAPMVKRITGKDLMVVESRKFADLLDFAEAVRKNGWVALADSMTHPWRDLCADFFEAKKLRIKAAGGNPETARMHPRDWGVVKDVWAKFTQHMVYDPIHWCICGREGDVWEDVEDDEGKKEMKKTGEKMKTEVETGYEPSLLVQMKLLGHDHLAFVVKDRFDALTGQLSKNNPDIEFFRPHLAMLNLGGSAASSGNGKAVFEPGKGANWETIQARRAAILESIKDDLVLRWPSTSAAEKTEKIKALRAAFGTSSWTELESDSHKYPVEVLVEQRKALTAYIGAAHENGRRDQAPNGPSVAGGGQASGDSHGSRKVGQPEETDASDPIIIGDPG